MTMLLQTNCISLTERRLHVPTTVLSSADSTDNGYECSRHGHISMAGLITDVGRCRPLVQFKVVLGGCSQSVEANFSQFLSQSQR